MSSSEFMLSMKEDGNIPCDATEQFNKSATGCNVFCNVIDDTDIICEEVNCLSEKPNKTNDSNVKHDNEVICIDDSEEESLCINSLEPILNSFERNYLGHVPKVTDNISEFNYPGSEHILSHAKILNHSPMTKKVLSKIGFNLILCNFFSNHKSTNVDFYGPTKESMRYMNVPLKYCSKCGFRSESALILNSHLNLLGRIPLICCLCKNFSAKHLKNLIRHMKVKHKVPESLNEICPLYQCHFCEFGTNSLLRLKKHLRRCMLHFTLNSNLAPYLEKGDVQNLLLDGVSNSSSTFINPNSRGITFEEDFSSKSIHFNSVSRTTMAHITEGNKTFPDLLECGYCKASVKDLRSLGIHMEVVHNIRYSFNTSPSSQSIAGDKSAVVILDEDDNKEKKHCDAIEPPSPRLEPFRFEGDTEVERELAKMAIRKECLWCCRRFESLELFEEHMVMVHDDLKCDIQGFWLAIESGLSECSGFGVASTKICPRCSESFECSSSCHRHLLNCHWKLHLEECKWCKDITTLQLPYSLNVLEGIMGGLEAANGSDTSSSSFLSDIDSKEVLR